MDKTPRRSPLALALLALLYEEPMHPYRMQQLIKERGKDEVINVRQRASIYQTIERLQRDGLLQPRETTREEKRPERTVYELTDLGRATCRRWLCDMLATPTAEFPEFPAALSFLAMLGPDEAAEQLGKRLATLETRLASLDRQVGEARAYVPRLFLLESEYARAVLATELEWVKSIVDDLRSHRLTWSEEWLRGIAASLEGPR